MTEETTNLPAINSVLECLGKDAYIDSKEHMNAMSYSVCCNQQDDGKWTLNSERGRGLRIILNKQPKQPVHKVRITAYCQKKNCCFGIIE